MSEYKKLLSFVEDNLNCGNTKCNAISYDGENYSGNYQHVRIAFCHYPQKQYNELLRFCADNNLIIISTHPATYETVIRTSTTED